MTLCIAAICDDGAKVIGISDRMITIGDEFAFSQPLTKSAPVTESIMVMYSDDSAIHAELWYALREEVYKDGEEAANKWTVKDAAEAYFRHYLAARNKRIESEILGPFSLGMKDFTSKKKNKNIDDTLAKSLTKKIRDYYLAIQVIICGVDSTTGTRHGHIYAVRDMFISCEDTAGFAAIGIGAGLATSQLVSTQHSKGASLADTLFLIYRAKKRGELAPGVGIESDIFVIDQEGHLAVYHDKNPTVRQLDKIYQEYLEREEAAIEIANTYTAMEVVANLDKAV